MSAKKRQEALERFSVPLREPVKAEVDKRVQHLGNNGKGKGNGNTGSDSNVGNVSPIKFHDDDEAEESHTEDEDEEVGYAPVKRANDGGAKRASAVAAARRNVIRSDSPSEFVFHDDDEGSDNDEYRDQTSDFDPKDFMISPDVESKTKKGKGKAKAVPSTPPPKKTRKRVILDDSDDDSDDNWNCSITNPPVMLISLKAGALGLNLTVANNVYLYVLRVFLQPLLAQYDIRMDPYVAVFFLVW
jgi:SWI/SNF-related matrix-associated actin-dependent regulator of chromatin subfamily A3